MQRVQGVVLTRRNTRAVDELPGGAHTANVERATEMLVLAARQGYEPSIRYLRSQQPHSYSGGPEDFACKPMPLMKFADAAIGRRVEIFGLNGRLSRLNGQFGSVLEVRPAAGRFEVEFDNGEIVSLPRRHLSRPFVAPLSDELARKPIVAKSRVDRFVFKADLSRPLGLELSVANLLVAKVESNSQAWDGGVRPGFFLEAIDGTKVCNLHAAKDSLDRIRRSYAQGHMSNVCSITIRIEETETSALKYFGLESSPTFAVSSTSTSALQSP